MSQMGVSQLSQASNSDSLRDHFKTVWGHFLEHSG